MNRFKHYSFFLLFYPVIVSIFFIRGWSDAVCYVSGNMSLAIIAFLIALIIINPIIKYIYLIIFYSLLIFFYFFEGSYSYLYDTRITKAIIFIIFETNKSEAMEFLSIYFDKTLLLFFTILLVPSIFILIYVRQLCFNYSLQSVLIKIKTDLLGAKLPFINNLINIITNFKYRILIISSIVFFGVFIIIKKDLYRQNIFYETLLAYNSYYKEIDKFQQFLSKTSETNIFKRKLKTYDNKKATYVMVIGESTNRYHLSLYNYYRETNPELNKKRKELYVFNDVISPHSHTMTVLPDLLTLGNYENPDNVFKGSVIQMMKQAGFKTYWISNQIPVGMYETMISLMAKASDVSIFINTGEEYDKLLSYDERLFSPLKKALEDNSNKKFIIIHLMGTHAVYKNRYPLKYNIFNDIPKTKYNDKRAHSTINSYDNAIFYNDYIVSSIINMVNMENDNSFVLYFSDHGEDVYDSFNKTSHNEFESTRYMFEIPFVLWLSDEYKKNNPQKVEKLNTYLNRKYMIDDIIFSIADLANIKFDSYEEQRSIFNEKFKYRNRIISDSINYDKN